MSKKRRRPEQSFLNRLREVDSLIERKRWVEARDLLQSLDERFPNREEIMRELLNVYAELKDMHRYQPLCERLLKLHPGDPDLTLAYAGACMGNVRPASALLTFRRFLQRYPQHERAAEVHKSAADLESHLGEMLASANFRAGDLETAALHEETVALLDQGKYAPARAKAEELLKRYPDFAPALNNIAQSFFAEGRITPAIAAAERVLALQPDNFHALSNLARYWLLQGQIEQAKLYAGRLRQVKSSQVDASMKKAEALSMLGDDQAVLDVFKEAERAGDLALPPTNAFLYHLAAVAEMRLGHADRARRCWQNALKAVPGFDLAKKNLDDLRKPVGEQHAPWAFDAGNWLMRPVVDDLLKTLDPAAKRGDEALTRAARRFLERHPEMPGLTPLLLDRGDSQAREFALNLAEISRTPEMFQALRDFALSQRGPDDMRWRAARVASGAGLIEQPVRMWMRGKWQELLLLDYEMHDEPSFPHPPRVAKLLEQSVEAMHDDDVDRAERLVRQGLELEPDAPDLLNNLTAIYERRGQMQQAEALLNQIVAQHPDYGFPHINLARFAIQRGDLAQAEAHLQPLLARKRFNFTEFGFFCNAQMELWMAKGKMDAVRSWMGMWEGVDPENPLLAEWRIRLKVPFGLGRLLRRRSGS
jgi:predicted Zn-dependent protease